MGREEIGDAAAVTPSLYLGHSLGMDHFVLRDIEHIDMAVEHIRGGGIVRTSVRYLAILVLIRLGMSVKAIIPKIHAAENVQPDDVDLSI